MTVKFEQIILLTSNNVLQHLTPTDVFTVQQKQKSDIQGRIDEDRVGLESFLCHIYLIKRVRER